MGSLAESVDAFVDEHLPTNLGSWLDRYNSKKIVHDGVWGTIALRPHEVALLDTPLLQRLRYIHQTGAAYLTYPTAVHTRFDHTLGVVHQVTRMCEALRECVEGTDFGAPLRTDLRLAALLHDVGHGPFSHTSEQYFASLPEIAAEKVSPRFMESGAGEILSAMVVESGPFRHFLNALSEHYQEDLSHHLSHERTVAMITGTLPDDQVYCSEIIHGPFDADKLDYMARDGMFSGLKLHIDLDRLHASVTLKTADHRGRTMTRLAGAMAGTAPLSQIMFNKMLLFTGIYHHHKVRAADCMIWALLSLALARNAKIGSVRIADPVSFLRLGDDMLVQPDLYEDPDLKALAKALRHRDLWRRALVLARRTMPKSMHDEASGGLLPGALGDLAKLMENEPNRIMERRRIADAIWDAAGRPCAQHEVWLDIPQLPSMAEAERMWVDVPGSDEPEQLGRVIPIAQWVRLYGTHKWRAHVFCPAHAARAVNLAAIDVLRAEYGLEVNEQATREAKLPQA